MIIYNETVIVEETVHHEWLQWMQQVHIPNVMATGHFNSYQILSVMDSPNEGVTYCIQYMADNKQTVDNFLAEHLPRFHQAINQQFENKFVLFNTVMQTVA
ncbi:MAG: DUF4286 family protein [Sphingobacteriaceae bacterium]|nr:MAG: DUF4286 family protein [Sphingobacteriaceae bacterium]